ncbi:hypothetical protein MA16_Dca006470 [Dendrobium catenatum]|uniref:Uncharacterized protein n=1 Tax=Dendrobium catenatum TaxID=906689 RepID=A0A2I0X7U7_9ASPA|nr:hypothetical protein MA16_Dca006470 [Dendrobium catenatum]
MGRNESLVRLGASLSKRKEWGASFGSPWLSFLRPDTHRARECENERGETPSHARLHQAKREPLACDSTVQSQAPSVALLPANLSLACGSSSGKEKGGLGS